MRSLRRPTFRYIAEMESLISSILSRLNRRGLNDLWFLTCVFVLLMLAKYPWVSHAGGPIIFGDELYYKANAERIIHGEPYESTLAPPLYSLVLGPAFLSGDGWYEWMLLINVLTSSMIVFPIWWLARRLLPKSMALMALILALLLPFHVIYPRLIMSENLFVFLFLLSVCLVLGWGDRKFTTNVMTGGSFALSYLTRYLFLAAIPTLLVVWWLRPWLDGSVRRTKLLTTSQIRGVIEVFAGFVLTYLPWLIYAQQSGASLTAAMGFGISGIRTDAISIDALVLWMSAYGSYLILVMAPYLLLLSMYIFALLSRRTQANRSEALFALLTVGLTISFLAVAIQHSWGQPYNYPEPKYILGKIPYALNTTLLYSCF